MQIPISWLREFCNPDCDDEQLAHILTMGGFEVEAIEAVAPAFSGVVVGEIQEVAAHPNADRLRVCRVATGSATTLQIVCGAPNARVGLRAPLALVGAALPAGTEQKPFVIRESALRGVQSQGMLCSAKELGLDEDASGLMELDGDAPVGEDIRRYLWLDDKVLTLKLTPNLGHALSVYGLARELSALTGTPLQPLPQTSVQVETAQRLAVQVKAKDLCGRFTSRVMTGITQATSTPSWMRERLKRCGQRSVNPLVDISNYVMFEMGQPSHIFDSDKLDGPLTVEWAQKGESVTLLNGSSISLADDVGIIRDTKEIESLAGIMGGQSSAVNEQTHNILIEAAFWWPEAIAGKARRYGFSTDAGHRFERGVDPQLTLTALHRISHLVQTICGGQAGPIDDQILFPQEPRQLHLRTARASKVIGISLSTETCQNVFERLQFVTEPSQDGLKITIPSYRFDIKEEEDLIEEVVRLYGYDALPSHAPLAPVRPKHRPETRRSLHVLKRHMASLGYLETVNYSFVPQAWEASFSTYTAPIALLNPIASQMNVMRTTLMGSLLHVLKFNVDRRSTFIRLFEAGRIFIADSSQGNDFANVKGVRQPMMLAGLAYSDQEGLTWHRKSKRADFYEVKGDVESLLGLHASQRQQLDFQSCSAQPHPALHPGKSASIVLKGNKIGYIGELHPKHVQEWDIPAAPVLFEIQLDALTQAEMPQLHPISKLLPVERDISILVPEATTFKDIQQACARAAHGGLLQNVALFDVFRPKAEAAVSGPLVDEGAKLKSLALRLTLADSEKNLTDLDIDAVIEVVFSQLSSDCGAKPRT